MLVKTALDRGFVKRPLPPLREDREKMIGLRLGRALKGSRECSPGRSETEPRACGRVVIGALKGRQK